MSVHTQLTAEIARQLAPKIRPRYLALTTERFVFDALHVTMGIRDAANRQLVTAIEVLSPTNKRGKGREEYLVKRRRILVSSAHLIEIDLLRAGQRVLMGAPLPTAPYFVFLSRADKRPMTHTWPIGLEQPLPVIPVALLPGDPDVSLDLQVALTTIYDVLGYDLAINYSQLQEVALTEAQARWADEHMRDFRDGKK